MIGLPEIRSAHARIEKYIHRTPVLTSRALDDLAGRRLRFKCENFQKVGAFKARGAHNAVFSLSDAQAASGVATHSSGNHAAALALAARNRGIPAYIVMPANAPDAKKASVARYGAHLTFCTPTLAARESTAAQVVKETGAHFIHPYDDLRVIAGQGTVALELMDSCPDLDAIVVPLGGGGQLSGVAVAAKALNPRIRVYGAEPKGADDGARSFASGTLIPQLGPNTIADGLLTSLGDLTFPIIRAQVDGIVTVSEEQIVSAMRSAWEILKIVIEPSAAVALAAVLFSAGEIQGRTVGIVLSGGNLDLAKLPWLTARPI